MLHRSSFVIMLLLNYTLLSYAQQRTYLGDAIFKHNPKVDTLDIQAFYTQVEIGHLFSKDQKHGLIFQQIDSIKYINELKLVIFDQGQPKEKLIETFEIGHFYEFKRIDMNHDGYLDLIITQGAQNPYSRLYVFDPRDQILQKIPTFRNYRAAEQVANSNYFYTYTAMGCADAEWKSKLFKVEGIEIVDYGVIHGRGCFEESKYRVIEIEHGKVKKTLPFDETLPYHGDKWFFIKNYWESLILKN